MLCTVDYRPRSASSAAVSRSRTAAGFNPKASASSRAMTDQRGGFRFDGLVAGQSVHFLTMPSPPVVDHDPVEPLDVLLQHARPGHVDGPRVADVLQERPHPRERGPPRMRVVTANDEHLEARPGQFARRPGAHRSLGLAPVSERQHGPTPVGDRREQNFGERAVVGLQLCERLHKVFVVGCGETTPCRSTPPATDDGPS